MASEEEALLFLRRHCLRRGLRALGGPRSFPLRLAMLLNQDLPIEQRAAVACQSALG